MAKIVSSSNAERLWQSHKYRSLWQHPSWKAFQETLGNKTWILSHGEAYALVIKRSLPFGKSWLEVPRGPLYKAQKDLDGILEEIKILGKEEGAIFARFSPYDDHLVPQGSTVTMMDHHPETSLVIDLAQSEEDILAQMKPKGRYNIKVAQKHDVHVVESDDIDEFYDILKKTTNRDGFAGHPKAYYRRMLEGLGIKAKMLLAKHKGEVIAGGIFVFLDEWAIYYYGASDHEHRTYMAPYLVQWQAMKLAKKEGCKYYDFLGIAPEGAKKHAWAGVTQFKKKFGGHMTSYPQAREITLSAFWHTLYKLYKKVR